jgi:phosphoglycolate phosphatase
VRGRLAIFDLDGTLVDSREDLATAANAARSALGLPALSLAEVSSCVGDGLDKLIERVTPGGDAAARASAKAAFAAAYERCCCHATRPYAGIPEALAALCAHGWALGVATNKGLAFSERILSHCGIRARFAAVRGGDRTRKPDPTALLEIVAESGSDPRGAWMIGDHRTDLAAGRAAGMRVAWCAWGIGHRDGLDADAVLEHPADVPRVLLSSGSRLTAGDARTTA